MSLHPDQCPQEWDRFVTSYEQVFEPLTDGFACQVFDRLGPLDCLKVIDVACGTGGAAMIAARRGANVCAIDASPAMVARTNARAAAVSTGKAVASVMDAAGLTLGDDTVDVAYSGFGAVLLPQPAVALGEMHRVLRPGGRAAIVTWTEPQHYELAALLRLAAQEVRGPAPPSADVPPQLRYVDSFVFSQLVTRAGFADPSIQRMQASLRVASVEILASHLAFAPGMAATLSSFESDTDAVLDQFAMLLKRRFGDGPVELNAVAHAAIARKPG